MERNRSTHPAAAAAALLAGAVLASMPGCSDKVSAESQITKRRIDQGFAIAPVRLDLAGKDRNLVGLGSYNVNAIGACNDCHSCPSYAPGHNPYARGDGAINAANYLAGGVAFGPFITSKNITPDAAGLPAGLTRDQFIETLRTGMEHDEPGELLEVMPWPVFRNMTDQDLEAIYEYLRAIPHSEPGACGGPGE